MKQKIAEIEKEIKFFGGKDFDNKNYTMGEILEDEGLTIAFGKSVKLQAYKDAQEIVKDNLDKFREDLFGIVDYHKNHGDGKIIVRGELIKKLDKLLKDLGITEEPKLVKCPSCKSAFYVNTKEKKKLKQICPMCSKEVGLKIFMGEDKFHQKGVLIKKGISDYILNGGEDDELKTLKDLDEAGENVEAFSHHAHLRQEAIKWVKEDRDNLIGIFPPLRVEKLKDIERWMERLNITEEDLQCLVYCGENHKS